jgi:hypothetical protein
LLLLTEAQPTRWSDRAAAEKLVSLLSFLHRRLEFLKPASGPESWAHAMGILAANMRPAGSLPLRTGCGRLGHKLSSQCPGSLGRLRLPEGSE